MRKQGLHVKNFMVGAFIGAGGILPGVSGGVLAIVFNVYTPIMEVIANPKQNLRRNLGLLIPVGIGAVIGFIAIAFFLQFAFAKNTNVTLWLFIGLIVGTIPQMFKEAGSVVRHKGSYVSMILGALGMAAILGYMNIISTIHLQQSTITNILTGIIWGLGTVIPGLSTSSILISLGLYESMLHSFSSLDLNVYVTTLPATVLTVVLFAKLFMYILKKYHTYVMHAVVGITISTTLFIIPITYSGVLEIVFSALCGVIGCMIALSMGKMEA